MNDGKFSGFNNWRKMKGGEINNLFKYKPATTSHMDYLMAQGWESLSGEIYLAGQEEFNKSEQHCTGVIDYFDGTCSGPWVTVNYFEFYMMSLHNAGIWTDVIDNSLNPSTNCHWLAVREMADDEINKYFW